MDAFCVVYVATYSYIYIIIIKKRGNKDVDTMCGNASFTVTNKSRVSQYQILLQQRTSAMASLNHITH